MKALIVLTLMGAILGVQIEGVFVEGAIAAEKVQRPKHRGSGR